MLDAIKADGTMAALDMGTVDQWESATMGFQNIGPNYWKVKKGVRACSPAPRSSPIRSTSPSGTSLPAGPLPAEGYEAQTYPDSQNLFTLGQAAIFPAGSWEISLNQQADFAMGAFPPPLPEGADTCYISD